VEVEENDGVLDFETTEFESPEYKELREDVEATKNKLLVSRRRTAGCCGSQWL